MELRNGWGTGQCPKSNRRSFDSLRSSTVAQDDRFGNSYAEFGADGVGDGVGVVVHGLFAFGFDHDAG